MVYMHEIYKIPGAKHNMDSRQYFLKDPSWRPSFPQELEDFKQLIIDLVNKDKSATFIHFGDGDYYFLSAKSVGSASVGKRAISVPYHKIDIERFREGFKKCDYHCLEIFEFHQDMFKELFPDIKTLPTEFLYGLTMSRWFTKTFRGKIGLIGADKKIDIIKELMKNKDYQEYLGLDSFNDYIKIPQKYACDDIDNTIDMVKEQLLIADKNTKIFLFGVGHVKSGLIHHLPKIKNAVYIDIGGCIDGLAGIYDPERPFALDWINHRIKNYDYSQIDLLQYVINKDKNLKFI